MATVSAIHALCSGLAQTLGRAHQISSIKDLSCVFSVVGTSDFKKLDGKDTTCSIFLYRVTHNEHMRNMTASAGQAMRPLAVDMHLLFTFWADNPLKEQTLLAWVVRELHQRPVLDNSTLGASGQFDTGDRVQLIPEELSLDDMTKLWQALVPPYRPSVTYVARNVPIGLDGVEEFAPVVATRHRLGDRVEAP